MEIFHDIKCKGFTHMIDSLLQRELFLAMLEEIKITLGKPGVMDFKRITIRKGEEIQTHTFSNLTNQQYPRKLK